MRFIITLAILCISFQAIRAKNIDGNGRPGCKTSEEIITKIYRNNWDPTRYWLCEEQGVPGKVVKCPGGQAFNGISKICVDWKDWVWIPAEEPPSSPENKEEEEKEIESEVEKEEKKEEGNGEQEKGEPHNGEAEVGEKEEQNKGESHNGEAEAVENEEKGLQEGEKEEGGELEENNGKGELEEGERKEQGNGTNTLGKGKEQEGEKNVAGGKGAGENRKVEEERGEKEEKIEVGVEI